MNDWTDMTLDDVAYIQIGGTPSREISAYWASTPDSGFPWVSIADLKENVIVETKERITEKGVLHSNVKPISAGTLIMSFKLSIGRAALAGVDLYTNEAIAAITPKDTRIYSKLLYYVLPIVAQNAITDTAVKGATLNKVSLGKLYFRVPSECRKQKKIAKILNTIDRTIAKTEALIEKYQQIKAGLMHDLFTRGIGADGKLRSPREEAPELYQETAIGWIPKEWDCSPLQTKSKPGIPHLKTGPFGSSLKGEHWVEDGVPVITIGSLGEGEFDIAELLFINDFDANRLHDFQMKLGDVVFSRVADVGRSVAIDIRQVGWIMSSNLMRISLDNNLVQSKYLQYQLSYDFRIKKQIRCKVNSGGRDVANSEVLNSLLFAWAKIDEQLEIVKRAKALNSRINCENNKLHKLHLKKSGLMHDLLTGKVSVDVDPAP
jgi:type I restriction enzyme, S subunit